jgi:hypothetical protein
MGQCERQEAHVGRAKGSPHSIIGTDNAAGYHALTLAL